MRLPYLAALWFLRALFILVFRGRAFGRHHLPHSGGVLLCSNHQSYFDPVILGLPVNREVHYVARDTLFRNPWFRKLISYFNALPVKRGSADLAAMKESIRRLKAGHPLLVFPEGTRTRDGSVGPMHGGVILLARRAGVPIVPAAVMGVFDCWNRHHAFPRVRPIVVAYGPPLPPERIAQLSDDECIAWVRHSVLELCNTYSKLALLQCTNYARRFAHPSYRKSPA